LIGIIGGVVATRINKQVNQSGARFRFLAKLWPATLIVLVFGLSGNG